MGPLRSVESPKVGRCEMFSVLAAWELLKCAYSLTDYMRMPRRRNNEHKYAGKIFVFSYEQVEQVAQVASLMIATC